MMQPQIDSKTRPGKYLVKYDEYSTAANEDGTTTRTRTQRTNSFDTERDARERCRAIEAAHARGEIFCAEQDRPVGRLRDIALKYAQAAKNPQTRRYRMSMMNKFLAHVGDDALVTCLSREELRAFDRKLQDEGIKRIDRFVGEVERMWKWADDEETPGVPKPKRIVGKDVFTPPPVFATDTPTFDDCDAMIAHLGGWHEQVATILRYTGVRASQALTLDRSDVELDRGLLRLRANARGAKGATGHRAVPMHPALVAAMRTWNLAVKGPIFLSNDVRRKNGPGPWREDALAGPFTRAWTLSGVSEAKWGAPDDDAGGRVHARPAHSFRGAFKVGLLGQGVPDAIVNLLVGHANNSTHAAYVPQGSPTTSPYWKQMVEALAKVPAIKVQGQVIAPVLGR